MSNYDLPFALSDEEEKEWKKDLEYNPFTEEYTDVQGNVVSFEELQKKRDQLSKEEFKEVAIKTRKESSVGNSSTLVEEIQDAINENQNKKGTSPRQESDSPLDELKSSLNSYDKSKKFNIHLNISDFHYYELKGDGEELFPVPLSNFLILPLYTMKDEENKTKYLVKLINAYEQAIVTLEPKMLASNKEFKTALFEAGGFNWKGKPSQLDILIDILLAYRPPIIQEINYVGWHETEKGWFYQTHAYIEDQVYFPDEDGIIITDKKRYFIKENDILKTPVEHIKETPKVEDIRNVLTNFEKLYGVYGWLGIGFTVSTMHVNELAKKTKQHPFLYSYGIRNTGKTEYLKNVLKFSAIDSHLPPPPRLDGLRKRLMWFSHLPVAYDEAEEKSNKQADFFAKNREALNTIFNRTKLERGSLDPNGLYQFPVRATLSFAGEVATSDSAITTRTVFIDALKIHHDEEAFEELEEREEVMYWLGQFMMRTSQKWKKDLFDNYEMMNNRLKEVKGVTGRVRKNYAILLAGAVTFTQWLDGKFDTQFYSGALLTKLVGEIEREMAEGQEESNSNHPAITYLKDLSYLANKFKLTKADYLVEGNILYIAPEGSWRAYEEWKKNPHYASSRKVANDLRSYTFYLGTKPKRICGKLYKCWQIDMSKFEGNGLEGFLAVDNDY